MLTESSHWQQRWVPLRILEPGGQSGLQRGSPGAGDGGRGRGGEGRGGEGRGGEGRGGEGRGGEGRGGEGRNSADTREVVWCRK